MSKETQKAIDNVFEALNKINPEANYLSEQTLSEVSEYIDTGCYVLNAIMSGSLLTGGIPKGRITGFIGPSQTGKTYIINKIPALRLYQIECVVKPNDPAADR